MADARVKHGDLIHPETFPTLQGEGEKYLQLLNKIEDGVKSILAASAKKISLIDPKTIAEYEQHVKELKETNSIVKVLSATEKERKKLIDQLTVSQDENVKGQIRYKLAVADQNAILKQQVILEKAAAGSINELRSRLSIVTKQWSALSKEERENSQIGRRLVIQKRLLTEEIKKLERATGDHRRNVGNYSEALDNLPGAFGRASQGAKQLGQALKALLANPVVLAIAAVTAALYGLYRAFISTDSGAVKFNQILGRVSATMDVVRQRAATLAKGLVDIFSGDFDKGLDKVTNSFKGFIDQTHNAQKAASNYAKEIDALEDAEAEFVSNRSDINNKIAKLEFLSNDKSRSNEQRRKDLQEALELGKQLSEQEKAFAEERLNIEARKLAGLNGITEQEVLNYIRSTEAQRENASAKVLLARENNEALFLELEKHYAKSIDADTAYFEENKRNIGRLSGLDKQMLAEKEEAAEKEKERRKRELDDFKKFKKELDEAQTEGLNDMFKAREANLTDARNKDLLTEIEYEQNIFDLRVEALEIQYQRGKILKGEYLLELTKLEQQHTKFLEDEQKKRFDKELKESEQSVENYFGKKRIELAQQFLEGKIKTEEEYAAKSLELDLQELENKLQVAKDYGQETADLEQDIADKKVEIHKNELDRQKELDEKEQERRKKQLEDTLEFAENINNALLEASANRIEQEKKLNDQKLSDLDQQLATQAERLAQGEANSYAAVQRERAKAIEERAAIEERERKQKEREQLAEIYFEFVKEFADDPNGILKALAKTAEAYGGKTLAQSIAGSLYEGTEDTGKASQPLDSKGGRLYVLHDNERVVPQRINKQLEGIPNDQLPELYKAFKEKTNVAAPLEWFYNYIGNPAEENLTTIINNKYFSDVSNVVDKDYHNEYNESIANSYLTYYYQYEGQPDAAGKALSHLIAGSAYDGVADTGGAGNIDSKGGKLWVLHPHEGVAKQKANEQYPGLVGAMNKGKVEDWMLQNIAVPQIPVSDKSPKQEAGEALALMLNRELQDLKRVIKDKRELSLFEGKNGLIIETKENGVAVRRHNRANPIVNRLR